MFKLGCLTLILLIIGFALLTNPIGWIIILLIIIIITLGKK